MGNAYNILDSKPHCNHSWDVSLDLRIVWILLLEEQGVEWIQLAQDKV
jgi:hypothetical protein